MSSMSGEIEQSVPSMRAQALEHWDGLFADKVKAIPENILNMTELELEQCFKRTPTDYYLRKNFWAKTDEAKGIPGLIINTSEI